MFENFYFKKMQLFYNELFMINLNKSAKVLTCFACLCAHVPTCVTFFRAYVLKYQRTLRSHLQTCLACYVPACLACLGIHVLTCLVCSCTYVSTFLAMSRAHVTTCLESLASHGLGALVITSQNAFFSQ